MTNKEGVRRHKEKAHQREKEGEKKREREVRVWEVKVGHKNVCVSR